MRYIRAIRMNVQSSDSSKGNDVESGNDVGYKSPFLMFKYTHQCDVEKERCRKSPCDRIDVDASQK